jgi:hypothetical protein
MRRPALLATALALALIAPAASAWNVQQVGDTHCSGAGGCVASSAFTGLGCLALLRRR